MRRLLPPSSGLPPGPAAGAAQPALSSVTPELCAVAVRRLELDVDLLLFDDPGGNHDGGLIRSPWHLPTNVGVPVDSVAVAVGVAVISTGIPIQVWCWAGRTGAAALCDQIAADVRAWRLSRVVWGPQPGGATPRERDWLNGVARHVIVAEQPRSAGDPTARAVSRPGRYQALTDDVAVKDVGPDQQCPTDRLVICRSRDRVESDRAGRRRAVAALWTALADSDGLSAVERAELAMALRAQPAGRFLRTTPLGLLRVDRAKVVADARFDGKLVLRTSDHSCSAADVVRGYYQLIDTAGSWHQLRTTVGMEQAAALRRLDVVAASARER